MTLRLKFGFGSSEEAVIFRLMYNISGRNLQKIIMHEALLHNHQFGANNINHFVHINDPFEEMIYTDDGLSFSYDELTKPIKESARSPVRKSKTSSNSNIEDLEPENGSSSHSNSDSGSDHEIEYDTSSSESSDEESEDEGNVFSIMLESGELICPGTYMESSNHGMILVIRCNEESLRVMPVKRIGVDFFFSPKQENLTLSTANEFHIVKAQSPFLKKGQNLLECVPSKTYPRKRRE